MGRKLTAIRLDEEQITRLKKVNGTGPREYQNRGISALIRTAVTEFLERVERKKK